MFQLTNEEWELFEIAICDLKRKDGVEEGTLLWHLPSMAF